MSGYVVHPCREDKSIRIAVSTVTGRLELYPDLYTTITGYLIKYLTAIDARLRFLAGVEEGSQGMMLIYDVTTCCY